MVNASNAIALIVGGVSALADPSTNRLAATPPAAKFKNCRRFKDMIFIGSAKEDRKHQFEIPVSDEIVTNRHQPVTILPMETRRSQALEQRISVPRRLAWAGERF
jgi:hypothetical protein